MGSESHRDELGLVEWEQVGLFQPSGHQHRFDPIVQESLETELVLAGEDQVGGVECGLNGPHQRQERDEEVSRVSAATAATPTANVRIVVQRMSLKNCWW
jgi:hypothetical protein